jgi:hypothetical protein
MRGNDGDTTYGDIPHNWNFHKIGDTGPRPPVRLIYTDRAVVRERKMKSSTVFGFEGVGQNLQKPHPHVTQPSIIWEDIS